MAMIWSKMGRLYSWRQEIQLEALASLAVLDGETNTVILLYSTVSPSPSISTAHKRSRDDKTT